MWGNGFNGPPCFIHINAIFFIYYYHKKVVVKKYLYCDVLLYAEGSKVLPTMARRNFSWWRSFKSEKTKTLDKLLHIKNQQLMSGKAI